MPSGSIHGGGIDTETDCKGEWLIIPCETLVYTNNTDQAEAAAAGAGLSLPLRHVD